MPRQVPTVVGVTSKHIGEFVTSRRKPLTLWRRRSGPRGEGSCRMLEASPAGRAGTPDKVGTVGELLMSPAGAFVTGGDILMDDGVTASYWYGPLNPDYQPS